MTLYGGFKDFNDVVWNVEIHNNNTGEINEFDVYLGETPVLLRTVSSGLFSPIKSRAMTIEVVLPKDQNEWFKNLYEPASRGTNVKLWTGTVENQDVYFRGYLTPCRYDQTFTYLDTVQLEAVDALSTCKDFKWNNTNKYENFLDIIISILKSAGYRGNLYVPRSYEYINQSAVQTDVLGLLYASSTNFLDDNEEHTPWTQYEVIEEIMKFLGWSMVPAGDDVWCIDYRAENSGDIVYTVYDINGVEDPTTYTSDEESTEIVVDDMAAGESKLSIDDIYNKIEVSDNLYKIDEIAPDIFEDNIHVSINEERGFDYQGQKWSKEKTSGWLFWKKTETKIMGYDYQTICRLDEDHTGWKHYFYKKSNQTAVDSYYDPTSTTQFNVSNINKWCNTSGCLIQHHAFREETGNNLPNSLEWEDLLTFFTVDDTCNVTLNNVNNWELPVLEYTTGEEIMFKPSSGTTWITLKGDILYQNNKGVDKDKDAFTIINYTVHHYATCPVNNLYSSKDDSMYFGVDREIDKNGHRPNNWGEGWECWKMKLQIDDKFWDGEKWVTYNEPVNDPNNDDAPTFYISYNNGPGNEPKSKEFLPSFDWASPVNTSDYKDKVGVDGYCIPIAWNDDDAPTKGLLKLTIYIPKLIPSRLGAAGVLLGTVIADKLHMNYKFDAESVPWTIFVKDFELGVVYTDTQAWWNSHDNTNNKDKVYIGYIDESYKNEFDGVECKLNTTVKDKPISRSYVTTQDTYLSTMKHVVGDEEKVQEFNIVDMYLDHNSERKVIFNRSMKNYFKPNKKFNKNQFDGTLMIDTQSYDVKNNNNAIKFIEF